MAIKEPAKPWKLPKHKFYVLRNGNVVDTVTVNIQRNSTVTVRDGLIASVEDDGLGKQSVDDVTVIDLNGRLLLPLSDRLPCPFDGGPGL